jgi:MEKHLA domain.
MSSEEPNERNNYKLEHAQLLLNSFRHLTGRELFEPRSTPLEDAIQLWNAPFVVLSHTPEADPIFNYGNRTALRLFEMTWQELTQLPSRYSAEALERSERERLLNTVAKQGYIDHYQGVRIAKSGRRFMIKQAVVWNLIDAQGNYLGQAASFAHWDYL